MLARLAGARQMLGDHRAALQLLDRAKALGHDNADFRYIRAVQLLFNGKADEAEAELKTCLRMGSTYGRASVTLARLHKQTPQSNHIDYIRAELQRVAKGSEDHAAFEYALYKELEDLGDYDAAWAALERGSAVMYARLEYDAAWESRIIDGLTTLCSAEFLAQAAPQPQRRLDRSQSSSSACHAPARLARPHPRQPLAGRVGRRTRRLRARGALGCRPQVHPAGRRNDPATRATSRFRASRRALPRAGAMARRGQDALVDSCRSTGSKPASSAARCPTHASCT